MAIIIREADLVKDKEILIGTLNENREEEADERRYQWLYLDNPHGPARSWLALDDRNGQIAGSASVFPKVMDVFGEEMVCWTGGDLSVNKRYRRLGVATQLRLAAKREVDEGKIPFLYVHPNDDSKGVYLRAGYRVLGEMVTYVRILRVDRWLPRVLKKSWLANGISWAYDQGLSLLRRSRRFVNYRSEIHEGIPEAAPLESLVQRVRARLGIFVVRNSEYLRWRFGKHPWYHVFTFLLYEDREGLVGYALYSFKGNRIYVNDLFCAPERDAADALVDGITEIGRSEGAEVMSVALLESNPVIFSLKRNGYVSRPQRSSVPIHVCPLMSRRSAVYDKSSWFMTDGDRDI